MPLDALESRGKDDCLRTPPLCARVSKQLGSSKVFSGLSVNVDFLVGESDDLLAAEESMHLEGETKNNARGCEIATCAALRPWERRYKHAFGGGFKLCTVWRDVDVRGAYTSSNLQVRQAPPHCLKSSK